MNFHLVLLLHWTYVFHDHIHPFVYIYDHTIPNRSLYYLDFPCKPRHALLAKGSIAEWISHFIGTTESSTCSHELRWKAVTLGAFSAAPRGVKVVTVTLVTSVT